MNEQLLPLLHALYGFSAFYYFMINLKRFFYLSISSEILQLALIDLELLLWMQEISLHSEVVINIHLESLLSEFAIQSHECPIIYL